MSPYTTRQNMTTGRWVVVHGQTVIMSDLSKIEALSIARELNTNPEHPWS